MLYLAVAGKGVVKMKHQKDGRRGKSYRRPPEVRVNGCLSLAIAPQALVEMSFRSPVDAQARMNWCLSPDQQQPYNGDIPCMSQSCLKTMR